VPVVQERGMCQQMVLLGYPGFSSYCKVVVAQVFGDEANEFYVSVTSGPS